MGKIVKGSLFSLSYSTDLQSLITKNKLINMKRFFLIFFLVGVISMLQAQSLQKTALNIEKFKGAAGMRPNPATIQGLGSDEDNYYVFYSIVSLFGKFDASFFVINKKLANAKEYPLSKDKEDRFLWVQATEEELVILLARDKKGEQRTQIIKQGYAKTTGKLKKETVIASFPKSKSEHWYFYSSTSPDKTKKGFLFMLAGKKNTVDSYYATVLNQDYDVAWETTNDLEISNESFNIEDIAITNKGDMYVAFYSKPKDEKKSADKNSYIDLVYLTDGSKDKMNFRIDEKKSSGQILLKALKNNDVYLAGLFTVENPSKRDNNFTQKEFLSIKINGSNFNVSGSYTKKFEERYVKGRPNSVANMGLINVLELNNGDIAVLCEQSLFIIYTSNNTTIYTKIRGAVTTLFVKGEDASIDYVSVMDKTQSNKSNFDIPTKALHLSVFPFVYGNKVGYIFNDCLKRYTTPAKYKEHFFKSANGDDASIVLNLQENGEKAEITPLTGRLPAKRLVREILFQENDRLVILTRNRKEAHIEILTLP